MHRATCQRWGLALTTALAAAFLSAAPPVRPAIILATTTSTQDSGLLDELVPLFEKQTGFSVKTIAVGSGQALALGRRGEADVLLVHSPEAEVALVAEGSGVNRRIIMHNDFVLVGPSADPAGIANHTARESLQRIAVAKALL